jgi:hypothetical protein
MAHKLLSGHTSQATAHVVHGYPFGRVLKTPRLYWIETKKGHGQRMVTATAKKFLLDAYTDAPDSAAYYEENKGKFAWNATKASTYSSMRIMYIDESTGYVENTGCHYYEGPEKLMAFAAQWESQFDDEQRKQFGAVIAASRKVNAKSWVEYDAKPSITA